MLVHQRWENGHSIISTHGGLILLAVPFQVMLATLPLATVLIIPDSIMRENRRLEFALILYIFILAAVMKYYPILAKKYIGVAIYKEMVDIDDQNLITGASANIMVDGKNG